MRWVTFTIKGDNDERVAVLDEEDLLCALPAGARLIELISDLGRLQETGREALRAPAARFEPSEVTLLAPIPQPPSVRDFYAFEQHVRTARQRRGLDMEPDWYELPIYYFTNPAATKGPNEDVEIAPGSHEMDFELEIAAVVGPGGADLSPRRAERCIAGFTIMNDWSARDLQRREMKLNLGPAKGKDFATSLGPMLVTPDELDEYREGAGYDLTMTARVNGVEYSRASWADIHWSFGEMLSYASRGTRLVTGDVVGSGTCGTGCILELSLVHGEDAYPWLGPDDVVELEVEALGTQRARILPARQPVPYRDRAPHAD